MDGYRNEKVEEPWRSSRKWKSDESHCDRPCL